MVLTVLAFSMPAIGFAGQRGAPAPAPAPQQQAPSGQRPSTGNQPSTTTQPAANPPSTNTPNSTNPAPIFILGNVMLSDGTPAPPNVAVHIVCGTRGIRTDTYTDPGGNFNIMLTGQGGSGFGAERLFGCEVRATLGGYLSSSIPLDRQSPLDDPNVGTIYLHRIGEAGEGEGYGVSMTTKLAPKDARKEYEKGLASEKKQKWPDAEQEFLKAVMIYPKYAVAWYELGRVYQNEKKLDDAMHAQQQSIQIEPKFVGPYAELTTLAFQQQKWADVAQYTSDIIKLAPYARPEVFFYNAAANYNLHQIDAAEKSARTGARLDDKHKVPRINYILGLILEQKRDFKGAAENLRLYLKFSPAAADGAAVQQQVAKLENASGGQ